MKTLTSSLRTMHGRNCFVTRCTFPSTCIPWQCQLSWCWQQRDRAVRVSMGAPDTVFLCSGLSVLQNLERPRCPELSGTLVVVFSLTHVHLSPSRTRVGIEKKRILITCWTRLNSGFVVCSMMTMIACPKDLSCHQSLIFVERCHHLGAFEH